VYRYNNIGYNIAGALIEEISGHKLDEYLKRVIYEPLGMTDTYHDTWDIDNERVAKQYWLREGQWEVLGGTPPPLARANGGMISTAWDFAMFCQMLLDKGEYPGGSILRPQTVELATRKHIEVSEAYLSVEVESEMGLESEWYEYRDARDLNIDRSRGLGFVVSDSGVYSHAGIYGTFFYVDPARELFGIILTQSIYGDNPGQAFIDAVNATIID
jgi:CubicO group peptidase (beta-lactamase class C family)